jgi:hypothetical protein
MDMLQKWLAVMERRADGVPMSDEGSGQRGPGDKTLGTSRTRLKG